MNNTLIKWPGGKMNEYQHIRNIIPEYKRYIEPFFGGGGIFFKEEPEIASINDYNSLLMNFYKLVKRQDEDFEYYLKLMAKNWDSSNKFLKGELKIKLIKCFYDYRNSNISKNKLESLVKNYFEKHKNEFNGIFTNEFAIDREAMFKQILERIIAKIKRMKKIEKKKEQKLPVDDIKKNIETGFKSGFYTHFRNILNDCNLDKINISKEKHIAIFYFIREFCYGSMFRYNSSGEFNIPYGGMSYNDKNFQDKVDFIFKNRIKKLFKNVKIYDLDFEKFLIDKIKLTNDDFIFFDPPYDTEFSTYGGNPFDKSDHERLADIIENLKAKCILIIKGTDFIKKLYSNRCLKITSFEKLYSYNVRGRNNRDTEHLIVTNNISKTP